MPPAERLYRTEAVVLRRQDLGEADRILTIFARGYGKTRVVAKGVRKPASRKAGHVELFMRVDVLLAQGRTLDVVSQAQMLDALRNVVLGKDRFDAAFQEYINRWAFKHPTPWDFFHTMENVSGEDLSWFWRAWVLNTWKLDQTVKEVN